MSTLVPGVGITQSGNTYSLSDTGVVSGVYGNTPNLTVNAQGQLTQAVNNTVVQLINAGTGIFVTPNINENVTVSLLNTGVVPATYNSPIITVNAQGQITNCNSVNGGDPSADAYIYDDFFNGPILPNNGNNIRIGGDTLWTQTSVVAGVGSAASSQAETKTTSNEIGVVTLNSSVANAPGTAASIRWGKNPLFTNLYLGNLNFEIRWKINSFSLNATSVVSCFFGTIIGFGAVFTANVNAWLVEYPTGGVTNSYNVGNPLVTGQWYKLSFTITQSTPNPIFSFYENGVNLLTSGTGGFAVFTPPSTSTDIGLIIRNAVGADIANPVSTSIDYVLMSKLYSTNR